MKRIGLFLYYLWALLTPQQDVFVWSIPLAWRLAGIAAAKDEDYIDYDLEFDHYVDWS